MGDSDRLCIFLSPLDFLDSFARTLSYAEQVVATKTARRDHHRIEGATLVIFIRRLIRCTVFAFLCGDCERSTKVLCTKAFFSCVRGEASMPCFFPDVCNMRSRVKKK